MKPYSDNIIFLDTEFSSLNPYKGELLSIGLVKLDREELYLELEFDGDIDDWTKNHVLPFLTAPKIKRSDAVLKIQKFVGSAKPYMVAYVSQFDAIYFYKFIGLEHNPFFWIPIDFASMLFAHGIDPESYYADKKSFVKKLGIDKTKFQEHHALDDARLLREVYMKLL